MKKIIFGITLLLVVGLFLAGCSKTSDLPAGEQNLQDNVIQDKTETQNISDVYVDEQIIDETEGVEIGEMI